MNWSELQQRLAATGAVDVFFRDDDVDEDEPTLRRLLELFAQKNVPVILGVIPARLTNDGIQRLAQFPMTIEIVQHGWQHVNHELTGRKCEFGNSRSFAEQLADIAQGQTRMREAFDDNWFPAFIPPWNRCTPPTCQALDQLGFHVLSQLHRDAAPRTGFSFQEISVTLDLFRWKDGARLRPQEELFEALSQQLAQPPPIGILLHHKVMHDEAFLFLEQLLDTLRQASAVCFHTFESLEQYGER
jgi:peptidoglycan/xylan/chitin deacetylase (PgdA/CDA1 family)